MAFRTWEESSSGYYLFDPMDKPYYFDDLVVERIVKYDGPVYECIHAFIQKNYMFNTLWNAYFENKICIEKNHIERVRQTINAKGVIAHEILLRTIIKSVD
jgi:hypothetical protein